MSDEEYIMVCMRVKDGIPISRCEQRRCCDCTELVYVTHGSLKLMAQYQDVKFLCHHCLDDRVRKEGPMEIDLMLNAEMLKELRLAIQKEFGSTNDA